MMLVISLIILIIMYILIFKAVKKILVHVYAKSIKNKLKKKEIKRLD